MKTRKKAFALVLSLIMICSVFSFNAFAANPQLLSGFGESVGSLSVSGANVLGHSLSTATRANGSYINTTFTYNIVLDANTAPDAAITVAFTRTANAGPHCIVSPLPPPMQPGMIAGNQSLEYDVALNNGVGTTIVYVHHDLMAQHGRCDTYIFNFARAEATQTITSKGLAMQFGDPNYPPTAPECDMMFSRISDGSYAVVYAGTTVGYYPNSLALFITSGATGITSMSATGGVSSQPTTTDGSGEIVPTADITSGFYVLTITADGTLSFTTGQGTTTLYFDVPDPVPSVGSGVYAYLPAPGQFTNEGVTSGGWGDAFVSGSTTLKGMVNDIAGTGVSLGYFGGYVVADIGTVNTDGVLSAAPVTNDPNHPYGVDFIVYGNAFKNNSEPGCIQVAEGQAVMANGIVTGYIPADINGDGVIWYDIAGSLHYDSNTDWDAEYTYTNSNPSDDSITTLGTAGTWNATVADNNVHYTCTPADVNGSSSGSVDANSFHRHSFFPLYVNYFTGRNGIAAMDKTGVLPFATYTKDTDNGSTLKLSGVRLGSATNLNTANYTFGYCDVHPNGSNAGVASNPYAATEDTTGGDGIDLSWAVYPAKYDTGSLNGQTHPNAGTPVCLNSVHFVRVYNGAAKNNGIYVEISTEFCGIMKATGTGSGAASTTPTIKSGRINYPVDNMGSRTLTTGTYKLTSSAANVYVNGVAVSATSGYDFEIASGDKIQIITQNGTESPFVTVLYCN